MSTTFTLSRTDTFTESRARYVMGKIFDDFNSILFRGFTKNTTEQLKGWRDDVHFIMEQNALHHFELQFSYGSQEWIVRYDVDKSGGISRDDDSGGIDFYCIPTASVINIVVRRDPKNSKVTEYLEGRGWTTGGNFKGETGISDRAYSKEGFGVNRKLVGNF